MTVDRLANVLEHGLIAPAHDRSESVVSDTAGKLVVVNTVVPYDSVIFLHQFDPSVSRRYLWQDNESVIVILGPDTPIKTRDEMDETWPVMCEDEVYSLDPIPPSSIQTVLVPAGQLGAVHNEFSLSLETNNIRLLSM